MTAPIDRIQLQHRACLYNDTSCDKNWELLTEHPPNVQSCDISLSPNQAFSYSVISCNDYFGCSNDNVIPIAVVTTVQGETVIIIICLEHNVIICLEHNIVIMLWAFF